MAVCVVCLLCADHLPCKQHIDDTNLIPNLFNTEYNYTKTGETNPAAYPKVIPTQTQYENKERDRTKNVEYQNPGDEVSIRSKRHAHHSHDVHNHDDDDVSKVEFNEHTRTFIKKIIERFSKSKTKNTLSLADFQDMLQKLDMYNLYDDSRQEDNCISSVDLLHRISSNPSNFKIHDHHEHHDDDHHDHSHTEAAEHHKNTTTKNTNETTNNINEIKDKSETFLSEEDLLTVCPILLYHSTAQTSREKSGCITNEMIPDNHHNHVKVDHGPHNDIENNRGLVWFYSSLSILGASLCGLLGVAVIPCMEKHFYNQILQFLVSLAVGTLTGDALLHLLPHVSIAFL